MKRSFVFFCSLLTAFPAMAKEGLGMAYPWQLGFQEAVTPVMDQLNGLHDFLLILITMISLFVLGLLTYVCLRFNAKSNPVPSRTTHNTLLEVVWTVIPVLILVAIAIPSLRLHYFMDRTQEAEMTLKIVGRQWYWEYEYPDQGGIAFESRLVGDKDLKDGQPRLLTVDNEVVIPVDTTVRVQVTGGDVIHAWAVPAFGVKIDAVPGRLNETWLKATRTGIYHGQCSELCGVDHGFMPITVRVVSKEEFAGWVEQQKAGLEGPQHATAQ